MIIPQVAGGPRPHDDMPDDVRSSFDEASSILGQSPRGAAALLRLAIQELCIHLGQPGKNLNDDIGALVAHGLPVAVQRALDVVRVIGNNAVHPGQIDLNDSREIASGLFGLVNLIVDQQIAQPRRIADLYSSLPASALQQIEKRDGANLSD